MEKFKYSVTLQWSDDNGGYVALIPELPGVSAVGIDQHEAIREVTDAAQACVDSLEEDGETIPSPFLMPEYSGQFRVRIPRALHQRLVELAKRDGVSLNSYILHLLSEKSGQQKLAQEIQSSVERSLIKNQKDLEKKFNMYTTGSGAYTNPPESGHNTGPQLKLVG